jgi:biopolymer transport protein ExbD
MIASVAPRQPIVIYRSVNRDGETYALEPRSLSRIRTALGSAVHAHPRVFIAHETKADYERVHGAVVKQVIELLTGVSEERLRSTVGDVIFRDGATERDLLRTEGS